MNWRQLIISSIVTLIVTILGGAAVYWLTRESVPRSVAAPKLYYESSPPAAFITETTKTTIYALKISNVGNKEAENVRLVVSFPKEAKIVEKKIEPSGGEAMEYEVSQPAPNSLTIQFPNINPLESCRASFLVQGGSDEPAKVSLRGKGVDGEELKGIQVKSSENPVSGGREFLGSLLSTAVALQVGLIIIALLIRRSLPSDRMNNLGFRYLHQALVDDALYYLRRSIESGPNAFNLSNFGQALALKGSLDQALIQCEIASEYASRKHQKMVVAYNRGCAHIIGGEMSAGIKDIEEAIRLEPRIGASYLNRNRNLAALSVANEQVKELLSKYPKP